MFRDLKILQIYLSCVVLLLFSDGSTDTWWSKEADKTSHNCVTLNKLENVENKKVVLTGFVPLLNSVPSRTRESLLVVAEAIIFAIQEANKIVLPKEWTLGYVIYDTCRETYLDITTEAILSIILKNNDRPGESLSCQCYNVTNDTAPINLGIVGPGSSTLSAYVSTSLSYFGLPVITYHATSIELNNNLRYPNFFRTIPDDSRFTEALVDIILEYGWSYVSIVSSDNSYGRFGRHELLTRFKMHKICVHIDQLFTVPYDDDEFTRIVRLIKTGKQNKEEYSASVVIIYAVEEASQLILKTASREELFDITWIFSDGTGISHWHSSIDSRVINGSFTILAYGGNYQTFEDYFWNSNNTHSLNKWLKNYLAFKNATKTLDFKENLRVGMTVVGYIKNAVFIYAHALKRYVQKNCKTDPSLCVVNSRELYEREFPNVSLTGLLGEEIAFNNEGNINHALFNILNIYVPTNVNRTRIQRTGYWVSTSPSNKTFKIMNNMQWFNGRSDPPVSRCCDTCGPGTYPVAKIGVDCCWICVLCPAKFAKPEAGSSPCKKCSVDSNANRTACLHLQNLDISDYKVSMFVLLIVTISGVACSVVALLIIYFRRNSGIIKASHFRLSSAHVFMQLLLFVTSYLTVALEKTSVTCILRFVLLGLLPPLVITFLLVKSEQILKVFKAKGRMSRRDVKAIKSQGFGMIIAVMGIYWVIIFSIVFTTPTLVAVQQNERLMIKETYCKNAGYVLVAEFAIISLLIIVCGIQSFRTRNLPGEYNDSTAVLYTILFLLLAFVVTIMLLKFGNFTRTESDLIMSYGLSIANYFALLTIYARKCWIAIKRPQAKRIRRGFSRFSRSAIIVPNQ